MKNIKKNLVTVKVGVVIITYLVDACIHEVKESAKNVYRLSKEIKHCSLFIFYSYPSKWEGGDGGIFLGGLGH